jgi:hypothetical protein
MTTTCPVSKVSVVAVSSSTTSPRLAQWPASCLAYRSGRSVGMVPCLVLMTESMPHR